MNEIQFQFAEATPAKMLSMEFEAFLSNSSEFTITEAVLDRFVKSHMRSVQALKKKKPQSSSSASAGGVTATSASQATKLLPILHV